MSYESILKRIRLLIPSELEGHYQAVRHGFEEGELRAPILSISEIQLARAVLQFTSLAFRRAKALSRYSIGV
jgi:hypothetical protein